MKKKNLFLLVVFFLVTIIFCFLQFLNSFDWFEKKFYDLRMQQTSSFFTPSENIAVVLLDQESLDWAKDEFGWSWPWPREAYADILDYFSRSNVSSFIFDMIYSENSLYGKSDDEKFSESSRKFGKAIQTVFYDENNDLSQKVYPIPLLKNSCASLGSVQSLLDKDGVARRARLFSSSKEKEASLSIAALLLEKNNFDLNKIPLAKDGGMYIRFQNDLTRYAPYNAAQILKSEYLLRKSSTDEVINQEDFIEPENFDNMHIFFGLLAPGLYDICSTPVSSAYPGVGVHISQLDTILQENYLFDVSNFILILLIGLFSFLGTISGSLSSKKGYGHSLIYKFLFFAFCIFSYIFFNYFFFIKGYILPLLSPFLALIFSFVVVLTKIFLTDGRQKRFIKNAFKQYLSPVIIENLISNPHQLKLGGEKRNITAYFSDIQGFTAIAESLSPEELTEVLNYYLTSMTDIILAYGGTIDKYEGDAIVAFWGAPVYQHNHAFMALSAAMACQKKLSEMQEDLYAKTGFFVKQRIGLNTGNAIVGNLGSTQHFNYTMIGDTVNLASRLEGINKQFNTYTLCSENTMKEVFMYSSDFKFKFIANIAVFGKTEGVKIFEPYFIKDYKNKEKNIKSFEEALSLYTNGNFLLAKEKFEEIKGFDSSAEKYILLCENYILNPPKDWDGIYRATEK